MAVRECGCQLARVVDRARERPPPDHALAHPIRLIHRFGREQVVQRVADCCVQGCINVKSAKGVYAMRATSSHCGGVNGHGLGQGDQPCHTIYSPN